ncbi:ribosomal protein S18 acetylase RimI-like enzyme [Allocatelliglobosispora scoriae]|uniref:Ribosomal protein S18 acetylase RimI-like enzyme n=1 Tax=Allocatelliglobosispora scoriae TaxID=643052 RepID=A0A841BSG0_9ACTN|nr:GNAT family N-acetyltransferase [Allocatelliglobosispora scoriae]MBB5870336.1 ribosomal protein S18 acetylase RimI-like enzyme [Allocatelliglobosispora scoriae]
MASPDSPALRSVHDRAELAAIFLTDPALYAYELGDLDDFFWPYTTWYRRGDDVALVYHGSGEPTLLAIGRPDQVTGLTELLAELLPLLPRQVYAHITAGAEKAVESRFRVEPSGLHLKMALTDPSRLGAGPADAVLLTRVDLPELLELYATAYPGNGFDPRMIDTGQYVGIRRGGALVAVAGVHVWSPAYRVAALGNVTTLPELRGQGVGKAAVTALCHHLAATVDHVGLNVKADNAAAVGLYAGLGFTVVGEYHELMLSS